MLYIAIFFSYLFPFFVKHIIGEVNRLELELQRVQKENLKNESLHNFSEKDDFTSNGEAKPEDYVNKLETEIQSLKSKFIIFFV